MYKVAFYFLLTQVFLIFVNIQLLHLIFDGITTANENNLPKIMYAITFSIIARGQKFHSRNYE